MSATTASLDDRRQRIQSAELSPESSHADPRQQFEQWFADAQEAQVLAVNAMALATVGADLRPSTRMVLLASSDERGLVWYTNYESRKAQELAAHPFAALHFHWPELERMVRVEGRVEKTSAVESDAYYAKRPLDMRIGAWASEQSRVIGSTSVLVAKAAKYTAQFMLNPPRPPHWGGFRLMPDAWQFFQARKSKLHDRLRYTATANGWLRERLAP